MPNIIQSYDPLPLPAQSSLFNYNNLEYLKPNDFQKYVLEVSGYKLQLFGSAFFESIQYDSKNKQAGFSSTKLLSRFEPIETSPVSNDYPIGQGDQIIIRGWGSHQIDVRAVVDRNGNINIPKVGHISISGIKFSQVENVLKVELSKYYKDIQINVSMGQLRNITIYTVGEARRPGSYTLSSLSTLSTAFFSTGGPSANGSMRNILLKRAGKQIAEFDLYDFLAKGETDANIKLIDGDVIFIPKAVGHVALLGKVSNPAVYELKTKDDNFSKLLAIAGGFSITADSRRAYIERLHQDGKPYRILKEVELNESGLNTKLSNGDIINIQPIPIDIINSVALRGNVRLPSRFSWREGMRIRDIIPNRQFLISKESIRRQNEVLFDVNQRERSLRERELMPEDLLDDPVLDVRVDQRALREAAARSKELEKTNPNVNANLAATNNTLQTNKFINDGQGKGSSSDQEIKSIESFRELRQVRMFTNQASAKPTDANSSNKLIDSIGQIYDEINWDYAVIERINPKTLEVKLVPFNLGRVLENNNALENYLLEPGDVITIFSNNDMRIPISKKKILVRIEGEVAQPGVYQAESNDTLISIIEKVGGLTQDAYLYGASFYREEVRKNQVDNLSKLLRKLEYESSNQLAQASQSLGATTDTGIAQARIMAAQQAQKQALDRIRTLKPEGRISLGLEPTRYNYLAKLPDIRLQNGDRLIIPSRPDFVYIFGAVNTDSALIYKEGRSVKEYLDIAGVGNGADRKSVILIRADGSALTSNGKWFDSVSSLKVMPGDSIVMPDKLDREASWSAIVRNAKDITQIFYQLGLGAAGLKALGY
jgi:protein involved in polysaccharide export with SLBB domain